MGRMILAVEHDPPLYVEWSTVVDAPVTYMMTRDELVRFVGETRTEPVDDVLARIDATGSSVRDGFPITWRSACEFNRAGEHEERLDGPGMIERYWPVEKRGA